MSDTEARDTRQRDLVPADRLAATHAIVVGVGAVGRQVAIQLAATGVGRLTLVDHDTVEVVNLGPQAYYQHNVGEFKVAATANVCASLNPAVRVTTENGKFRRTMVSKSDRDACVFCCVDSIETRKFVWEAVSPVVGLFVDCRMNAEVVRVLTAVNPPSDDYYAKELFPGAEAHRGSCTARSTVYSATLGASLMVSQYVLWLREAEMSRDFTFNIVEGDLIHTGGNVKAAA